MSANAMDRKTFMKLRELVYQKSGINLTEQKEALLCSRVGKRMRALGIEDYRDYLQRIVEDDDGEESVRLAQVIASNVLGVEEDDPLVEARADDAVKEMVNVLCGRLRTILTHESSVFEAAIPQSAVITVEEWRSIKDSKGTLPFLVEDHPLLIILSMEGLPR